MISSNVAIFLLNKGANAQLFNSRAMTVLHEAARSGLYVNLDENLWHLNIGIRFDIATKALEQTKIEGDALNKGAHTVLHSALYASDQLVTFYIFPAEARC
uniref:Uncharacterized protein n=1 Tax=Spongospora subterranea TaxID=70186 RepID=A0A0H5QW89_9EUKA|eukprot:CRZ05886.1 hypothetical protein [Spongospora subterranea]